MTYKESLHRIWLIAKREVHRLVAQPIYFFCMLIAPAICVIFFVSLMHEGLPTDLPIAVVDMDNSATSRNLIRQLDAFEQTEVYMKTMSFTEARQEMQKGNVYGIFYIPSGFAVDATSGKQPRLSFYTNGTYLIAASLLFRDMKTMSVIGGGRCGFYRPDKLKGIPKRRSWDTTTDRDRYASDRQSVVELFGIFE